MEERTITMTEIKSCTTWSKKDNSPRGCKTVSNTEIKPGDYVVYNNRFTEVIDDPAEEIEEQGNTTEEEKTMKNIEMLINAIEKRTGRSAWDKGVNGYAEEIAENIKEAAEYEGREPESVEELTAWMLNGARDWNAASWGGCFEIYDGDIAERLCTPSKLKKTRNGERRPNSREEWLDVQARALYQAARIIRNIYRGILAQQ